MVTVLKTDNNLTFGNDGVLCQFVFNRLFCRVICDPTVVYPSAFRRESSGFSAKSRWHPAEGAMAFRQDSGAIWAISWPSFVFFEIGFQCALRIYL